MSARDSYSLFRFLINCTFIGRYGLIKEHLAIFVEIINEVFMGTWHQARRNRSDNRGKKQKGKVSGGLHIDHKTERSSQ